MIYKYGDIKRWVLEAINQSTIAGDDIPFNYNNQDDYWKRIPKFFNQGLNSVRVYIKRNPVLFDLTAGEKVGQFIRYELPTDMMEMKTGGVCAVCHGHFWHESNYHLQGENLILLPDVPDIQYSVEYYRYPPQFKLDPSDKDYIEEDPDVVDTAVIYAASKLCAYDDPTMSADLYSDYINHLEHMIPSPSADIDPVHDVYAFPLIQNGGYIS